MIPFQEFINEMSGHPMASSLQKALESKKIKYKLDNDDDGISNSPEFDMGKGIAIHVNSPRMSEYTVFVKGKEKKSFGRRDNDALITYIQAL